MHTTLISTVGRLGKAGYAGELLSIQMVAQLCYMSCLELCLSALP